MVDRFSPDAHQAEGGTDSGAPHDRDALGDRTTETDTDDFFAPTTASVSVDGEIVGSRLIVLPEGCSRGQAIAIVSKDIPSNQFGLPQYFVRSDLLHAMSIGNMSQDDVDAASVGLHYTEGYPTLEDGRAFWNQLPHEDPRAFLFFQRYLEQAELTGIRQLDMLATQENTTTAALRELYQEFYWGPRARAHDLFLVAAQERKRQLRIRSMENSHYDLAETRLTELLKRFEPNEEGESWVDELNAKEAAEILIELAKLQRLSVGLTGVNASSLPKNALPEGASTHAIMEQLTKGGHLSAQGEDNFQGKLNALLEGDGGMQIQDAIIRFSRHDSTEARPFGMDE